MLKVSNLTFCIDLLSVISSLIHLLWTQDEKGDYCLTLTIAWFAANRFFLAP